MASWEQYQGMHDSSIRNIETEEQRNWSRFNELLQILNEATTSQYDGLTGNTRSRGNQREDLVRAYLVQGFMLLTSIMFNFGKLHYI